MRTTYKILKVIFGLSILSLVVISIYFVVEVVNYKNLINDTYIKLVISSVLMIFLALLMSIIYVLLRNEGGKDE